MCAVGQRIRRVVVEGDIHTQNIKLAPGVGPDDRVLPSGADEQKVEIVREEVDKRADGNSHLDDCPLARDDDVRRIRTRRSTVGNEDWHPVDEENRSTCRRRCWCRCTAGGFGVLLVVVGRSARARAARDCVEGLACGRPSKVIAGLHHICQVVPSVGSGVPSDRAVADREVDVASCK